MRMIYYIVVHDRPLTSEEILKVEPYAIVQAEGEETPVFVLSGDLLKESDKLTIRHLLDFGESQSPISGDRLAFRLFVLDQKS